MRQNDNFFNCYREIIPEFSNFQESIKTPFPNHIRVNTLKARQDWLIESLQKKGIYLEKSFKKDGHLYHVTGLTSPGNLMAYFLGHIHPQALTSCLRSPLALEKIPISSTCVRLLAERRHICLSL